MEVFSVSLFALIVSFLLLSIHFLFFLANKPGQPVLPPGKTGWPVIGESFEVPLHRAERPPGEVHLRPHVEVLPERLPDPSTREKAAVFCGANGNKFLFSNENTLVQSWWPSSVEKIFPFSTQTSSKEEAIKMRKMLPKILKPEALHRYVGIMDHIARRHFADEWDNKNDVVVYPLTKNYTFRLACRLFFSIENPVQVDELAEPFNHLASGLISIPINLPGTPFNTAIKASKFVRKMLIAIIKKRRVDLREGKASPMQDILSHMLLASDENGKLMQDLDIADKILGLLIGGHDTASSACAFIVKYLAELPQIYDRVYDEQMEILKWKAAGELLNWEDLQKMKYSWNVACEVLRLASPLQGAFREALTDFVYNGFSIPKGWKLYWSANSTHKNAEFFSDPLKFDPSRFEGSGPTPYTFVPFGGGPRMCPGKEYARLEILVFMHHLVTRFRWEKIIPDEKIVVDPMPIPAKGLPVRLFPHDSKLN